MLPNLIVPVLNRYDLLNRMLDSLDYPIRDLLIIDNGDFYRSAGLGRELPTVENVRILVLPSNLGVAASWNLGIKLFPHDSRWFFASNDMWFKPGGLQSLSEATEGALTLSDAFPHFHTFAVGEAIVRAVGLFDERYYPAFFEDTDMVFRIEQAKLPINRITIAAGHDNSSTIHSNTNFRAQNQRTFDVNSSLYHRKKRDGNTSWSYDLDRRRAGEWLPVN